jgi:hypothetical protein
MGKSKIDKDLIETGKPYTMSEKFNNLTNTVIAGYGALSIIITLTITSYIGYETIKNSIAENSKSIEITQMMILKDIVRRQEHNPCIVSDAQRDEYIENYTTLFTLKIKYKKLHKNAKWSPIEKLKEDTPLCRR